MASRFGTLIACALLSGCVIGDDGNDDCIGGKCDGSGNSCSDKRYGNGTCDLQLDCAVPDIDCFTTFEDDAAAATWFNDFEVLLAQEEHREPRKFLTPADPRWAKTRALLDTGWEAFKANRPVGMLREKRPALVFLEDPAPNAFVAPDLATGNVGFAVMVQTGLFETGGSQDGALGVMMHEFQHAVGLHIAGDMRDRYRKFYFAGSTEPLGKLAADDMIARTYGEAWRAIADQIGYFRDAGLRGVPLGGQAGQVLPAALALAGTAQVPACITARTNLAAILSEAMSTMDVLSGELTIAANLPARIDQALAAVKSACFASFTVDLIGVFAKLSGVTPAEVEAQMPADDLALVKNKHVIDGLSALVIDRRAKLRALEAELVQRTGKPWSSLRYFSTEEDADDVSVAVLRAANVEPPHAIGPFLMSFLPGDGPVRCADLLARRVVPPYGADLGDEHHSTCWRAHHARQVAEHDGRAAHRAVTQTTQTMPSIPAPRPLPIPRPLRDRLAY